MMISLIVAYADQSVIGFKNKMPWHLPEDLKHVKQLTEGNTIVMGRKTFESLGRPLPNRRNVVLTRDETFSAEGIDVINHTDAINSLEGKVFIFGGSTVYNQTMHLVEEMHITRIHRRFAGDTFFPDYDPSEWELVDKIEGIQNEKNRYPYEFLHYRRK
ncbi:dihydrofolate reductase [Salinicoccus siamensis]|uniref:Dihydrofolate reductase n=1 Tax=Salinicoccus siamensis TaxID=381830 RepID=A0ABV5Z168_9STAP